MTDRAEGGFAIAASLLVLFAAMLEPIVAAGLAVLLFAAAAAWKLLARR